MQEGTDNRSVIHSLRTVRRRCGFTRYRNAAGAVSHVPAAQRRAMHMLPPRIGVGSHDGKADACGVWRGALL